MNLIGVIGEVIY